METSTKYQFDTRSIHAGEAPDPSTGAHGVPIYQNTTFAFRSYDHVEAWKQGQAPHYLYSREGNPTARCFELKMADLEGAEAAVAGATGMAVIAATLLDVMCSGGHLIASTDLYEVTNSLICQDLAGMGGKVTQVDATDLAAVEGAIVPETRAILVETFSNPLAKVADLDALARIAHEHDALLIVDNTFLSPALLRPLERGADLVIHSATKYLAGHGQAMGGVVAGKQARITSIGQRLSHIGGAMSPFAAWLLLAGTKTLPLRMERHSTNGQRLAELLAAHPAVDGVNFPGLPGNAGHDVATRLAGDRFGGLLSFTLKGGAAATRAFVNALALCTIAVSLGECSTLLWPYDGGLIRLAAGLENPDDLAEDIGRGLEAGLKAVERSS
jgi:cystathionine beta-lyase/cystathionine gamma-synthase